MGKGAVGKRAPGDKNPVFPMFGIKTALDEDLERVSSIVSGTEEELGDELEATSTCVCASFLCPCC